MCETLEHAQVWYMAMHLYYTLYNDMCKRLYCITFVFWCLYGSDIFFYTYTTYRYIFLLFVCDRLCFLSQSRVYLSNRLESLCYLCVRVCSVFVRARQVAAAAASRATDPGNFQLPSMDPAVNGKPSS